MDYVEGCRSGVQSTTVAQGLASSDNVVALRLSQRVGFNEVVKLARRLGVSTPLDQDYNTILGGREAYLYEMARAYAVVANGGRSVPMHAVSEFMILAFVSQLRV